MENRLEYRNRYKLQRCVCIFVPCRQFILSHPVHRVSPERTKCIVKNFTGQYRLDGLTLSFAQQRFPFPSRCISPLRAYVYQNLSEPFTSQWHGRQSCTDYLLRAQTLPRTTLYSGLPRYQPETSRIRLSCFLLYASYRHVMSIIHH